MRAIIAVLLAVLAVQTAGAAEEILFSWNDRQSAEDKVVQEKVAHLFSEVGIKARWREAGQGSEAPNEISVWIVAKSCKDFQKVLTLRLCGDGDILGAVFSPTNIELNHSLRQRVYVFLPEVRASLARHYPVITEEQLRTTTSLVVVHEIAHLLLGHDYGHDKEGLLAPSFWGMGSPKFQKKTITALREAVKKATSITVASADLSQKPD